MAIDVKLDSQAFVFFFFFLFFFSLTQSHIIESTTYNICKNSTYNCGNISNISYPFWGQDRPSFCGSNDNFKLICINNHTTFIQVGNHNFSVISIDPISYSMKLVQTDLSTTDCPWHFSNTSMDPSLFRFNNYSTQNLTIFQDCPSGISSPHNITSSCKNNISERDKLAFYADEEDHEYWQELLKCSVHTKVAVQKGVIEEDDWLNKTLSEGFIVQFIGDWLHCSACSLSGGMCGTAKSNASAFSCHCLNGIGSSQCPQEKKPVLNWKRKIIIAVTSVLLGVIATGMAFYVCMCRKKNRDGKSYVESQSKTISSDESLHDIEKGSRYFGVHLFTYAELEEATHNFDSARELGDGGFGTVYYGKLGDGRTVAVKRLYENNCRRVEQFINEVEILTRLRHQNLVSLYGCTSRHSRELLLVYEYVPNGTVADHLHGEKAKPERLPWHIRMNIAIETASALAYLHASDIIHRDVKTSNILLDNHFCVKVADFGLSRLFPKNDVTHVSTAPQGTPGYVDPEYHQCYQLTDKSDVYSFGVVLMELISAMAAVDITRHRHEINLSSMAINKIQNGMLHELVDPSLGFEGDEKVRKMINGVAELGFQCLQSVKDVRPSMGQVMERLVEIKNDGKDKRKAEEMDINNIIVSVSPHHDDVVLLKNINEPPPPSPDSNLRSTATTPNASR